MADDAREMEEPSYNVVPDNDVINPSNVPNVIDLDQLCKEVDQLSAVEKHVPLHIPKYVDHFMDKLESKLENYEPVEVSNKFGHGSKDVILLISAIQQLAKLVKWGVSNRNRDEEKSSSALNRGSSLLHRAMVVLEEQAALILEQWKGPFPNKNSSPFINVVDTNPEHNYINISMRRRLASFKSCNQRRHQDRVAATAVDHQQQQEQTTEQQLEQEQTESTSTANYSAEDVSMMSLISRSMILAGYTAECGDMFEATRRGAVEEELRCQGMGEKMGVEEVQRVQWESLEGEIATWMRILKHCCSHLLPCELRFYQAVFGPAPSSAAAWKGAYSNYVGSVIRQLVGFAHAVAITPKSSEKLFKFLDMYESLRGLSSWVDDAPCSGLTQEAAKGLKLEIGAATAHLGEAAVSIFCDLESSIRSDNAKQQPVPSGAVHPLIRYTMNYLKYTCEYKDTLEEVFRRDSTATPLAAELVAIIQLLVANLEAKSKLYKDPSLRYVFLMNNGRYMLQKIRGSPDLRQAVGDTWYRKKSSEMRSYHKSYQRDTWAKVLKCLSPEGLHVNGAKLQKPLLKERCKSFNQLFDDIHKTQTAWVVSDDQLKSELRVSISAVMIPAYRAFLARFSHVFTPGRQYEKHVKYQPDDIEAAIEELFDGNPTSMSRRRA